MGSVWKITITLPAMLGNCVGAEMAAGLAGMHSQFRPRVFGEKYWQRWVRSYPDIARKFYPDHS